MSRTSGLQRIDGCRSQPLQARKKARMAERRKQQWRESEANGWGKGVRRGGRDGWGGAALEGGGGGWDSGELSPQDLGAHLWVQRNEPPASPSTRGGGH